MLKYRTTDGQVIDSQKVAAHFVELEQGLVEWIKSLNTHNRKLRPSVVRRYAKRMRDGEFYVTNQGIGIAANYGQPFQVDGGHRIAAWSEAGSPRGIWVLLVTGLNKDAQAFVDCGASRSMNDLLALMLDRKMNNLIVSTARAMMAVSERVADRDDRSQHGFIINSHNKADQSPFEIAEFIDGRLTHHMDLFAICASNPKKKVRASVMAAIVTYADMWDKDSALEFTCQLIHGEGVTRKHPSYRLRAWIDSAEKNADDGQHYSRTVAALCAHARGATIDKLYPAVSWNLPSIRMLA